MPAEPAAIASPSRRLTATTACILGLVAVSLTWYWSPLPAGLDPISLFQRLAGTEPGWGAVVKLLCLFAVAAMAFLPVLPLMILALMIFGPLEGSLWSLAGLLLAAQIGFLLGRALGHGDVARMAGSRIHGISRFMLDRGVLKTAIIRVLPVAHFPAASFVLGASHVRWRDYIMGTLLGSSVAILVTAVMYERTAAVLDSPSIARLTILGAITLIMVLLLVRLQRSGRAMMHDTADRPATEGTE